MYQNSTQYEFLLRKSLIFYLYFLITYQRTNAKLSIVQAVHYEKNNASSIIITFLRIKFFECSCTHPFLALGATIYQSLNLALLRGSVTWVPWVPRNPSIFQQWVLEPIKVNKPEIGLKLCFCMCNSVLLFKI